VLLPATPGRGEAKAAVEQKFGLFSQTAPPLRVAGKTQREMNATSSVLMPFSALWGLSMTK